VKKSRFAGTAQGQPLLLPQGGHKGRPYDAILSHLQRGREGGANKECYTQASGERRGIKRRTALTPETGAPMRALSFMIGEWALAYTVTQHGQTSKTMKGTGSFRYLFNATYLTFDYQVLQKDTGEMIAEAHAIFAWDKKPGQYRYFWFESSGNLHQAMGFLRDRDTLALEWQDINCTQIFRRVSADAMYLEMQCPAQDLLLRVDFSRLPRRASVCRPRS
jgi:hypothetical protein